MRLWHPKKLWPVFAVAEFLVKKARTGKWPIKGRVRSIPAVVTTVSRPVKPGSRLVRSSTLTPQTSSLDAGKRDFSVSFSWLCSWPLLVFAALLRFFFALTIFYDNVETQKCFKWDSADILLCFNCFFFRLLQSNSLLVFPLLLCVSLAVIYFLVIAI